MLEKAVKYKNTYVITSSKRQNTKQNFSLIMAKVAIVRSQLQLQEKGWTITLVQGNTQ